VIRGRVSAALLILVLAAGCSAASSFSRTPRRLTQPPNNGLGSAVSECLRLIDPAAGVTAYASDGARLPFEVFAGHEPGTAPRCAANELRVLRLESLSIGGAATYLRRGGCQTPCRVREATVDVPANVFAGAARLLPVTDRRGDGAPLADCTATARNAPQLAGRELTQMFYKRPASGRPISPDTGARWSNYGNPGRLYRGQAAAAANYDYLLWNLPRTPRGVLHGGGIPRAVIAQGQPIELCPAAHLTLPAYDAAGRLDGDVEFAYAEVRAGVATALYGWVLLAYTYKGLHQRVTT
jgi:hypothetical protein